MLRELLCLEVVGIQLVALDMQFENCGSLHAPVPGLLFSMIVGVELVQEELDITFLDGQKSSLEFLSEVHLIVAVSLSWWIISYSAAC